MKAFRAYGSGDQCAAGITADSPIAAACKFFEAFPNKRKCSIIEGEVNHGFFTVRYGRASNGEWPRSWRDITKKAAGSLPSA